MEITRGKIAGAKKTVIYGPEGIGKSTFAAKFPDPVFIDTEGSTKEMDVARLPRPTSWTMLLEEIDYVKNNPGECGTLVIDTVDWAEQMCVEQICDKHHKSGIEEFGYGTGYVYVREEFGRFLNTLEDVVEKGVNVVLTAHSQMRKFEQPDEMGAYDRYDLKLGKKTSSQTSPLVKEWADMLLFANYKTYSVAVDDKGKKHKAQGGRRVMYTQHHPCWDAKNRYGLADEIPFEYVEIAHIFEPQASSRPEMETGAARPATMNTTERPVTVATSPAGKSIATQAEKTSDKRNVNEKEEKERKAMASFVDVPDGVPEQMEFITSDGRVGEPTTPKADARARSDTGAKASPKIPSMFELSDKIPKALRDLMEVQFVSEEELMEAVWSRHVFPRGTPFENLPKDYVDGVLIAAWPQVMGIITDMRKNYKVPFD